MSVLLSSSSEQRVVLFKKSFKLVKVDRLIAGFAPHIVLFEDRMFKGQVVMNVRLLVSLFNLMLWAHSRLRLFYRVNFFSANFLKSKDLQFFRLEFVQMIIVLQCNIR